MKSRLGFIKNRINVARHGQGGMSGKTELTLYWKEVTGGTVDAITGAVIGASEVTHNSGVPCFVHDISARGTVRAFAEIEEGDKLVDVDADLELAGLNQLTYELDGEALQSVLVSGQLADIFDVQIQGVRLTRTLHLRKAI